MPIFVEFNEINISGVLGTQAYKMEALHVINSDYQVKPLLITIGATIM